MDSLVKKCQTLRFFLLLDDINVVRLLLEMFFFWLVSNSDADGVDGVSETDEADDNSPERDKHVNLRCSGSQKRQKKHKKHKNKGKRRNQEKDSNYESGPEMEREKKHLPR